MHQCIIAHALWGLLWGSGLAHRPLCPVGGLEATIRAPESPDASGQLAFWLICTK
jgi:hypothetical protein